MRIRVLLYAIKYYFPWLSTIKGKLRLLLNRKDIPQKANARYCYSVWLRHLSILHEHGLNTYPSIVAELGPGDSIGVGLMALLTGSKRYYTFDVVKHTSLKQNAGLLDELIDLLIDRTDIPNEEEFPRVHPRLKSYGFPSKIITEERIIGNLYDRRIAQIKNSLLHHDNLNKESSPMRYFCPWYDSSIIGKESVDMVYSQAVLEHVNDLNNTYEAMYLWLKHGGVMSHQIDFKSHGTSDEWNGHWTYSDFEWKLIKGRKAYVLNREPLSTHIDLLSEVGFRIISVIPVETYPFEEYIGSIHRNQLARRFQKMSEEDFTTCTAHILSIKE